MKKLIEKIGGRKMMIFFIMFIAVTFLFIMNYDVVKYADALYPYVLALVIGNVGEHFAKK